jgi:hypothetical protein|tara:strand:+ start:130 stop:321 length:192 start_codon:yes stop_codon:yes gene_type:complete
MPIEFIIPTNIVLLSVIVGIVSIFLLYWIIRLVVAPILKALVQVTLLLPPILLVVIIAILFAI